MAEYWSGVVTGHTVYLSFNRKFLCFLLSILDMAQRAEERTKLKQEREEKKRQAEEEKLVSMHG